jgi:NifU-like protein involved in Fe-S cluster formation
MTERVKGMTLQEAGSIRNTEIAKELSLPPVKVNNPLLLPGCLSYILIVLLGRVVTLFYVG